VKSPNCDKIREHLSEYLDEALSGFEMQQVAWHLAKCPACRREFDDLRVTQAVLQREAVPPPAPDFWPRVYAQLRQQSGSIAAPRSRAGAWLRAWIRSRPLLRRLAVGGAVGALLLTALFCHLRGLPKLDDEANDFIAQHTQPGTIHPLDDWARMAFVNAEMNAPTVVLVHSETDLPAPSD